LGLLGLRPADTFIPESLFATSKEQVRLFLRHLWATGGSVAVRSREGRLSLAARSRTVLQGVARLLLRFGITVRLTPTGAGASRHLLDICERDDQLRFLREVGIFGSGSAAVAAERLLATLEGERRRAGAGTVPPAVWESVGKILTTRSETTGSETTGSETSGGPATGIGVAWAAAPGGAAAEGEGHGLSRIAAVLDRADLELHATNDVAWDAIASIEPLGEQDVYDATVVGVHNFVANGIATHNSIEQDADVVILLHRDDYYDKESPRAGEADFIVAKHRNGPTDTVTVAAQLHLSRFVDMAI
jgi:replicative DNA helicase